MRRNAQLVSEVPHIFPGKTIDAFVQEEIECIVQNLSFSTYDATFLVETGFPEIADRYVAGRRTRFSAATWTQLEELGDLLAYNRGALGAVLVFRYLLEQQLESNQVDIPKALSYINMVQLLGERVDSWGGIADTENYLQDLYVMYPHQTVLWDQIGWFENPT